LTKLRNSSPAPDQEHAGESNFSHDKDGAEALMAAALPGAGAGVLERLLQVAGSHAEARDEAEEDGSEDSDEDGPAQSGAVYVQGTEQGKCNGPLMAEPCEQDGRESQTEDGSGCGKDEALGEQLSDDAAAAGAESGAHREFFAASGSARREGDWRG